MKVRNSTVLVLALLAFVTVSSAVACGSDIGTTATTTVGGTQPSTSAAPPEGAIDEALLGKWQYDPGPETRQFNADGTMRATLGGLVSEGTYTADGHNLVITVDGIPRTYTYTIEGDVLTLVDVEFNQALNFNRVQ